MPSGLNNIFERRDIGYMTQDYAFMRIIFEAHTIPPCHAPHRTSSSPASLQRTKKAAIALVYLVSFYWRFLNLPSLFTLEFM